MANIAMGFRQIHLDFHTSPLIGDVGSRFDPEEFAATVAAANVDSVTCFAKCHHGHLYYKTNHPARHPSLPKGLDLLGEQIKALHARSIRAPIYISVQCDEYAANTRPEWIVRNADGRLQDPGPFGAGWQILDMSSPYQDFLLEQTVEVLERFAPADGFFFDMCWNQPSVSKWAKAAMLDRKMDPEQEADRNEYARLLALQYMKRIHAAVRKVDKKCSVYFNSRPLSLLPQDLPYMTHVEIEALATGGWGYMYFPLNVRYVRGFGRPCLGMTARFHKSWADFGGLKPEAALKYEVSQMISHGARCSIGDQLHPRGTLDKPAWEMIGRVYGYARDCQKWCEDATSAADIGVLRVAESGYMVSAGTNEGATRMLMQLKAQFDVLEPFMSFGKYKLLVLPDGINIDAKLGAKLDKFVAGGGSVLLSGRSGLDEQGRATWRGVPISGAAQESPYKVTYLRPGKELAAAAGARAGHGELSDMNHVMYERATYVTPAKGAETLGAIVEPYFDRNWQHFSSHNQTPPAKATQRPVAVVKGRVAYIAYPIFSMFGVHGSLVYRSLVAACMSRLVGRATVESNLPSGAEVSVMKKGAATVVHVLYWPVERRATNMDIIEDTVPLADVELSVALEREPSRAYLAPSGESLNFTWQDGRADVVISKIDGHQIVVFE